MKNLSFVILIISSLLYSCTKDDIKIDPDNLLIGTWNYSDYKDNTTVYSRSLEFINSRCYKFNSDGTLIERKISGWCATPPVSYSDYPGTWTILNDTLIQINVGYWGGTTKYGLDINSVNQDYLKIVQVPLK